MHLPYGITDGTWSLLHCKCLVFLPSQKQTIVEKNTILKENELIENLRRLWHSVTKSQHAGSSQTQGSITVLFSSNTTSEQKLSINTL